MEINSIPNAFQSKIRLSILTALMSAEIEFSELKKITETTDGNLSSHLSKLKDDNYIEVEKRFKNNKPNTLFRITPYGKKQFIEYVKMLEAVIKNN